MQRRVYDALNVMMALGLVKKEKQGMVQYNGDNCIEVEEDTSLIIEKVRCQVAASKACKELQRQKLWELLTQYLAVKKLMKRNESDASREQFKDRKIPLPFVVIGLSITINDLLGRGSEATMDLDRRRTHFTVMSKRAFTVKDDNSFLSLLNLDTYRTVTRSLSFEDAELLDGEELREYFRQVLSASAPSKVCLEEKSVPVYVEEEKGGAAEYFNELTPLEGEGGYNLVGQHSTPGQKPLRTALETDTGYLQGENVVSPLKSVKTALYGSRRPADECSN